ncbi:alkaline phosphatase, partial [bacterium]
MLERERAAHGALRPAPSAPSAGAQRGAARPALPQRRKGRRLNLLLAFLCALPAGAATVYPLDRSELLAGQAFDFKVELDEAGPEPAATVCGRPAAETFGRALRYTPAEPGVGKPALRADGVTLTTPGPCDVTVAGTTARWQVYAATAPPKAKNVILLIGDGLSLAHRTAARAMRGHTFGRARAPLAMDDMPHTALVGTSASNSLLPDSAQTATAYSFGLKTAVESVGVMADRTPDHFDDPRAEGLLELAKRKGLARGLVTTSSLVDATPAAFYGHTRQRYDKAAIGGELTAAAPEVALGGGAQYLTPRGTRGSKRKDSRDVVGELRAQGWAAADTAASLATLSSAPGTRRLVGVFADGDLKGLVERRAGRAPAQPGLLEMFDAALKVLGRSEKGFFLMTEGALIDKYSHELDWERAVMDTLEFDDVVARAKAFAAQDGNTLVLVVSDHAQGASVSGMVRDELPG